MNSNVIFFGRVCCTLLAFMAFAFGNAQNVSITGTIKEYGRQQGLKGVRVIIEGGTEGTSTNENGVFRLNTYAGWKQRIVISATGYLSQYYSLATDTVLIDLGTLYLKRDLELEKTDNLVTLTESELLDETSLETNSALLQATRDIFLSRSAFDFSQAFFRVRGYDSSEGIVLINGIPMNRSWDGRPQWNNWGGLNDVSRNQELTYGVGASDHAFGRLQGSTSIDISPSNARPGLRLSSASSNRTYGKRLMATYNSGTTEKGLAYSLSLSRRWADEGYVDGTFYDAYSIFAAVDVALSPNQILGVAFINAYNSRGRSAALTDEVANLLGSRYNPYWGIQQGAVRSSRVRTVHEPILMLNYDLVKESIRIRAGLAYQWGAVGYTRIGYFNATNPDPTYYRYLPSYYINSPIGANFIGAQQAKKAMIENPQWPWAELYEANSTAGREFNAAYVSYADMSEENSLKGNLLLNLGFGKSFKLDTGILFERGERTSYARIKDLMGAQQLQDTDPFTGTGNDVNGPSGKGLHQKFGYNYRIEMPYWTSFIQARFDWNYLDFYVAGEYAEKGFQRDGLYLNERYQDNSFGKGEMHRFKYGGVKGGVSLNLNPRHWLKAHGYFATRAPFLKHIYVNPRENHEIVPEISPESAHSFDLAYHLRLAHLKGRLSAYYSRFQDGTEVNFFYVDSGFGSDFVQQILTGLDRWHKGVELGLEYELSSTTKVSLVAALAKYQYASDPRVNINFDTNSEEDGYQKTEERLDLGFATIKGLNLAQGPRNALSFGINYRDPSYWWIGGTANYLSGNSLDISIIKRTKSFTIDPDTGLAFKGATAESLREILDQPFLSPIYLLNLVGGKSWLYKGHYISLFASINNVFNSLYKTGGYEQDRNGNYGQMLRDNLSGTPSFGPKFWYGFGRTFFVNLAVSF